MDNRLLKELCCYSVTFTKQTFSTVTEYGCIDKAQIAIMGINRVGPDGRKGLRSNDWFDGCLNGGKQWEEGSRDFAKTQVYS